MAVTARQGTALPASSHGEDAPPGLVADGHLACRGKAELRRRHCGVAAALRRVCAPPGQARSIGGLAPRSGSDLIGGEFLPRPCFGPAPRLGGMTGQAPLAGCKRRLLGRNHGVAHRCSVRRSAGARQDGRSVQSDFLVCRRFQPGRRIASRQHGDPGGSRTAELPGDTSGARGAVAAMMRGTGEWSSSAGPPVHPVVDRRRSCLARASTCRL